jgi:hypothetical protein
MRLLCDVGGSQDKLRAGFVALVKRLHVRLIGCDAGGQRILDAGIGFFEGFLQGAQIYAVRFACHDIFLNG